MNFALVGQNNFNDLPLETQINMKYFDQNFLVVFLFHSSPKSKEPAIQSNILLLQNGLKTAIYHFVLTKTLTKR